MPNNQPELKLMQKCYTWAHNTYPEIRNVLWRVENEGKRSKYQQSIAKSTGLTAGVADFNMVWDGTFYGIELKSGSGSQSKSQREWESDITGAGGQYEVVSSVDEFQDLINLILNDD